MPDEPYYLTCPPLDPFPLPQVGIIRIGRSAGCEIVLAHTAVSRLHAQLWWSNEAFVLRDEGSLNGTFVNRRRIQQSALKPGDRIRIGPFTLKLIEGQLSELIPTLQWEETPLLTGVISKEPSVALSGLIKEMELNEVVQLIGMSGKTGRLEIRADEAGGELIFQAGELIDATSGKLRGEEAVFELLKLEAGRFKFRLREVPPTRTIQRSTLHLLLEACRQMDEAQA